MLLPYQKIDILLKKINFTEKRIMEISLSDDILKSYIQYLTDWITALREEIRISKNEFEEFLEDTGFSETDYIKHDSQRKLLKDVLRTFEEIEERFYLGVDTFLPLIPVWIHQKGDEETRRGHRLIVHFIKELLQLSKIPEIMITILGEDYACLPLSWGKIQKHVVFVTYSEMENPIRWALLSHEIGHAFYDLNFDEFHSSVIPMVIQKLVETKPLNIGQRVLEDTIYTWTNHWIPELVSDCFSIKTLGPAYLIQFILLVLNSNPDRIEVSHPPSNLRVNFMIDILESLALPDFDIDIYRDIWNSYSRSITWPSSRYILQEEVVESALHGIDAIIQDKPIETIWGDIVEAKQVLSNKKIPEKNLVSIISAASLLATQIDISKLYSTLLERDTHYPDIS